MNPGNPTGTLNVYRFVITCNNINDNDDDDDDGNDNKISLFFLDIVFAQSQGSAFELSFHGVSLIKGVRYTEGISYIGVLFAGVFFFFSFFSMNSSLYRDVHYLGSR